MAGLVIGVGLSTSPTTEPEDLPWSNETDVIILPPPYPITNETDIVIIVTDPIEELNRWIDELNTSVQFLTNHFNVVRKSTLLNMKELYLQILDMESNIESLEATVETSSNEVNEQIESLENKISSLQATIVYACIATAIIAMLGAFLLIKRMK